MYDAFLAIHADVRLQAEVPLIPLRGRVHLRIALAGRVLGRTGGVDDGCIDDRAGGDADALRGQMAIDLIQYRAAQIVLFQ